MEMARCLTGWTVRDRFWKGQFVFRPEMHDAGAKQVLGRTIEPAGQAEAESVLEQIALHPATAHRLARKLVRRFLELAPEDEARIVERAAAEFRASGGEIRPMLRLILLDGVLREPAGLAPKLKRPVHVVASGLRMLAARSNGGRPIQDQLAAMGQPLFMWPTPDGPPEDRAAWQTGLFARWDFAYRLARNEIEGTEIDLPALLEAGGATGPSQALDALANIVLGARLIDPVRGDILRALSKESEGQMVAVVLAGLLASPAFQWR
jgi:uncharacterized protein (DUF1800 family)